MSLCVMGFMHVTGLKEEVVGLSLKGGIRWMVKPVLDAAALALLWRLRGGASGGGSGGGGTGASIRA